MNENSFNILDSELDKPIYRILDYDIFVQLLKTGKNSLVRTSLWNDPFENLLSISSDQSRNYNFYYTYAQCWSFSEENDLLWRTYSPNKESIKLKSTPRKLIESLLNSPKIKKIENHPEKLWDIPEQTEEITCFMGKVEYLTKNEISNIFKNNYSRKSIESYLQSLFIKREPFRNEEELRIGVYYFFTLNDQILRDSDNIFHYELNFNDVIEEIVFDPRISNEKFDGLKDVLRKINFRNPILKSEIYDKPDISELLN